MKPIRLAQRLSLLAGLMDFCTGLGLVFFPAPLLRLLDAPLPPGPGAELFLRWVGAFVAAVGACYLWALARGGVERLRTTLELTTLCRLAAGLFSAVAIARGVLSPAWSGVPLTDLALVVLQIWILRRKEWTHA